MLHQTIKYSTLLYLNLKTKRWNKKQKYDVKIHLLGVKSFFVQVCLLKVCFDKSLSLLKGVNLKFV